MIHKENKQFSILLILSKSVYYESSRLVFEEKKPFSMTNITNKVIDIHIFIIINCYTYRIINIARITDFYHKTLKSKKSQNLSIKINQLLQ